MSRQKRSASVSGHGKNGVVTENHRKSHGTRRRSAIVDSDLDSWIDVKIEKHPSGNITPTRRGNAVALLHNSCRFTMTFSTRFCSRVLTHLFKTAGSSISFRPGALVNPSDVYVEYPRRMA
ncbi:hypothetical protein WN55_06191 [Dufourea novaeangliae]|uniref:Uncharacterized protein n=1 Tax=Dufourea novaeangliae TaxID=178035 RepID=A0A154P257_DUFNO|nr:hypothetical protein WN55_06191 [Dufourea novaeangliae]